MRQGRRRRLGEIQVVEVERKEKGSKAISVTFDALGVRFHCYRNRRREGGIIFFKSKLGAQVYDKNELWVPGKIFAEIYRRAAGILYPSGYSVVKPDNSSFPERPLNSKSKNDRRKKGKVSSRTFRRPVNNHNMPLPF